MQCNSALAMESQTAWSFDPRCSNETTWDRLAAMLNTRFWEFRAFSSPFAISSKLHPRIRAPSSLHVAFLGDAQLISGGFAQISTTSYVVRSKTGTASTDHRDFVTLQQGTEALPKGSTTCCTHTAGKVACPAAGSVSLTSSTRK